MAPAACRGEFDVTNRHLTLSLALALALGSSGAHALGLGQLQVKSGLSQPLVAEIPIISATPAELEQLDVRLASPDAFARVGLELPVELTANLQFSLGKNSQGQPVIRITTPQRFTEPFLSFLIEADWGKGRVTREYTALIDPPYISPAVVRPLVTPSIAAAPPPAPRPEPAPAPVAATVEPEPQPVRPEPEPARPVAVEEAPPAPAPEALPVAPPPAPEPEPVVAAAPPPQPVAEPVPEPVQPAPEPEPVAAIPAEPEPQPEPVAAAPEPPAPEPVREPEPEPAAPQPEPEPVAAAPAAAPTPSQYGPVAPGQTLFSIANTLRQDGADVNQMMLALLRANPEAFANDNVNALKSGSVLRVPRQDEITQLSDAEAASLVNQQMQAWRGPRAPVPQPEEASAAPEPVAAEPAPAPVQAPAPAPKPPRTASRPAPAASRLEIVPPSGNARARGAQSGAAAGAGGTELRAELAQAREDLAARSAEVKELKSRVNELEQQQSDRQRLIDMQNSQLRDLQQRLSAVEGGQPAASASAAEPGAAPITIDASSSADAAAATPAAAAAPAPAPAEPAPAAAAEATPPAAPTWYLNPYLLVGALLVILGGLVLLMRRSKPAAENGDTTRRISDDEALRASIAKTRDAGARIPVAPAAPVIVPSGKAAPVIAPSAAPAAPAPSGEGELALKALQEAVKQRPNDLEAHISLLRFLHSRGDAEAYQDAAQAMRAQLSTTMDPRWREAVVMGASLLPKTQLFSQAGWNSPRFENDGAPAPAAPRPVAAPVPAPAPTPPAPTAPVAARATAAAAVTPAAQAAPVRVFEPPVDDEPLLGGVDIEDPNLFGDMSGGAEDEASATRIELAKAYLAIGDLDGARSMLEEVMAEGGAGARAEAARILKEIG